MVVVWSPNAKDTLKSIFDYYLHAAGRKIAEKITGRIRHEARALGTMPLMAPKEEQLPGNIYRSLLVNRKFKVIYRVNEAKKRVEIITLFDCRQDPDKMREGIGES